MDAISLTWETAGARREDADDGGCCCCDEVTVVAAAAGDVVEMALLWVLDEGMVRSTVGCEGSTPSPSLLGSWCCVLSVAGGDSI